MAYDKKYRIRAVEYRKEGNTIEATAKIFKVGTATIKTWTKMYDENGGVIEFDAPRRTFKKIDPKQLALYVENNPDAYLSEIAAHFNCWPSAVERALKKQKITLKKKRNATKNKTPKK
jgi:transposase